MYKLIILFYCFTSLSSSLTFNEKLSESYQNGDYTAIINSTNSFKPSKNKDGYISYLRGSSFLALSQFELAKISLIDAYKKRNREKDIFYKIGQTLYALDEFKKSRIFFKKSIERKYKIAVSLYYIGFTSSKLRDYKTAVRVYSTIEKLSLSEKKDVIQAARYQIADIYFEQVKTKSGIFDSIKNYVIPQYQKAVEWDEESILAEEIKKKIRRIEQQYEIVLYQMRNGRRTSIPRYFLKGGFFSGYESNVNDLSEETLDSSTDDVSSPFIGTSLFSRYSYYPSSTVSVSPEFGLIYKKYLSTSDSIKSNDEVSINIGGFFAYEHFAYERAATSSLRLNYNLRATDSDIDSTYSEQDSYFTVTASEELEYFKDNPTVLRLSHTTLKSVTESKNSSVNSFTLEQLINSKYFIYYLYSSYDFTRYPSLESEDTNSFTIRNDFIFNSVYNVINLGPYFSYTNSNFINDSNNKNTDLIQYGLNLNRPIIRKVYLNTDISYETQVSDSATNYSGYNLLISLDYIY
jgi:hypothetical protein